jgi:hypothetical protein
LERRKLGNGRKWHGRRKMIGEGRFWEVEGSERRERIGGGRKIGDTKRRCRGKGGKTWDPSAPMGRRELRWWGRGGRDPGGRVKGRGRVSPRGWSQCLRWRGRCESGSGGESRTAAEGRTR